MPVIGFINSASAESFAPFVMAFRQGLSETGYIEGRNVAVKYRWADEQYDRLPGLAADLVRRQADVTAAISAEAAAAEVRVRPDAGSPVRSAEGLALPAKPILLKARCDADAHNAHS